MTPEDELRYRLHGLADRAGHPPADGPGLAHVVARRTAERRRTRRGVLVALGGVVLLGLALPRLTGDGVDRAAPASGVATEVPVTGPAGGPRAGWFDGPTRGSLAGDRAFVEGVKALPWAGEPPLRAADGTILYYLPDPPVEARTVVFAGEVPGGRWALVVGRPDPQAAAEAGVPPEVVPTDTLTATWFAGPVDASPEEMTPATGPNGIAGDWPVALTDPRSGVLVVVAAPGDTVEVSQRPLIDADGRTTREWRPVETDDGVAVTRVSPFPRPYDGSTSYRVMRGGRLEARDMPWSVLDQTLEEQLLPIEYPRGRPNALGEQAAQFAASSVLSELGLSPAQVTVTAQWVGSVPSGAVEQAAVVTVSLPSGAVVVAAQLLAPEQPDGSSMGAYCGQAVLPAGPPAGRRVQAVACETVDHTTGARMSTNLVVVGPPEVALIRAYDGDRGFLAEHTTQDGILVVPMPLGTETVEAVTAGGVTLGRVDLLGHAVDFGD
jgi:hypothetical protein